MKKLFLMVSLLALAGSAAAAEVQTQGQQVTICPDGGQAKVIRLEVINDNIIRVRATSKDALPEKPASLMIVPQAAPVKGSYTVSEEDGNVVVKAKNVKAVVSKATGEVTFFDAAGKELLKEAKDGKKFWDFTVPEREYGIKNGFTVPEEAKHGLSWQMKFDSPDDEAFYGLGQHQSEEFNMKGKNEDLFQYNTKVSIPFVLSNKNYGLLWDSYSYCRFGNPNDYLQLNRAFKLYDRTGKEGHLTGTYVDAKGKKLVRDEDSIYYEYVTPEKSAIALKTDNGGIKNFPKDINLMGANVTYEGFIEPECCGKGRSSSTSSSFIIQAMSRSTSMARRLCPSVGARLGILIPISSAVNSRKVRKCSSASSGVLMVARLIVACVFPNPVVLRSVANSLYGVRWPRIWTIISSQARISIRSFPAIAR